MPWTSVEVLVHAGDSAPPPSQGRVRAAIALARKGALFLAVFVALMCGLVKEVPVLWSGMSDRASLLQRSAKHHIDRPNPFSVMKTRAVGVTRRRMAGWEIVEDDCDRPRVPRQAETAMRDQGAFLRRAEGGA